MGVPPPGVLVRQQKFLNVEPAVADRVIDRELREVIQSIWALLPTE